MKPLPAQHSASDKTSGDPIPSLPTALATPPPSYSTANRRASACPSQRFYPWLLFSSTAVAGVFCLLYITKPVVLASQSTGSGFSENPVLAPVGDAPSPVRLMPDKNRLPGETASAETGPSAPEPAFEQTNLRIQHILTAEAPGGQVAKIDIDVPVLYQSRNLRWTADEIAEARDLLVRLADYQEKSRSLRTEGAELLDSWNRLVERSIPAGDLRADSPTLPMNQQDAADAPRPAGFDTTESIQIQAPAK